MEVGHPPSTSPQQSLPNCTGQTSPQCLRSPGVGFSLLLKLWTSCAPHASCLIPDRTFQTDWFSPALDNLLATRHYVRKTLSGALGRVYSHQRGWSHISLYLGNCRLWYPDSTQLCHDDAFELPCGGRNNVMKNNKTQRQNQHMFDCFDNTVKEKVGFSWFHSLEEINTHPTSTLPDSSYCGFTPT